MKKIGIGALLTIASLNVQATEKLYGIAGAGYSEADYENAEASSENFYLALGHEFAPKWYVEAGYKRLFDEQTETANIKGDALYLAVLGKAGSRSGELFYKLGVMRADISGFRTPEGDCEGTMTAADRCMFDEGVIAGMAGLGFDFHVGINSMIRVEYEYIHGEKDLSANMINIGYRYNFN